MAFGKDTKKKKSGDVKLADGAAAREHERLNNKDMDQENSRESLISEVQDSAEQKRAAGDVAGAERSERALELLTQSLLRMETRIKELEERPQGGPKIEAPMVRLKCPTCGQVMMNAAKTRGVCGGEHVYALIAPQNMDMWTSFPGVEWNGVKYAGRCMLPPTVADSVKAQVGRWESTERKKFINTGKVFGDVGDVNALSMGRTRII